MTDERRRWTAEDITEAEELIRVGMAFAVWEDAVASALEESRQPDGDDGMTEVLQNVDRTEPEDAAFSAADDLRKLYAAANGTAAPGDVTSKDAELALEVANDAVEQRRMAEAEIAFAQVPAPMFLLARKASAAMGFEVDEMMGETDLHDFGYYAYMEAVGHGVAWSDSHPKYDHKKPSFDSHLIGVHLSWSGRSGDWTSGVSVSGEQKTSIEYDEPEVTDIRTIRRIESEISGSEGDTDSAEVTDDEEVVLEAPDPDEETWVDVAVQYLRDQGATEPSSSAYYRGVWYSSEAQQDFRSGVWSEVTCHLGDTFTEEERRAIFDEIRQR